MQQSIPVYLLYIKILVGHLWFMNHTMSQFGMYVAPVPLIWSPCSVSLTPSYKSPSPRQFLPFETLEILNVLLWIFNALFILHNFSSSTEEVKSCPRFNFVLLSCWEWGYLLFFSLSSVLQMLFIACQHLKKHAHLNTVPVWSLSAGRGGKLCSVLCSTETPRLLLIKTEQT